MSEFITVGLDLSLRSTGICCLASSNTQVSPEYRYKTHSFGMGLTGKGKTYAQLWDDKFYRLIYITACTEKFIFDFCEGKTPDAVVVEDFAFSRASRSASEIAMLHGFIISSLFNHFDINNPIYIPSTTMKKYVTGHGRASKEQIMETLESKWGKFKNDDEADAFCLAFMAMDIVKIDNYGEEGFLPEKLKIIKKYLTNNCY